MGNQEPNFLEIGDDFAWIDYLGPNHGTAVSFDLNLQGTPTIWVLVDTTKIIDESHENNNKENLTISKRTVGSPTKHRISPVQ